MEKKQKPKWKIFSFLPKTVSPVTFTSPPLSPVKANSGRAFSVPVVSLIPKEARRSVSFQTREPTSPKVSCVGEVRHRKKNSKPNPKESVPVSNTNVLTNKSKGAQQGWKSVEPTSPKVSCVGLVGHRKNKSKPKPKETVRVPNPDVLAKKSKGKQQQGGKSVVSDEKPPPVAAKVPSLGHMNKFSSGRGVLEDFDWKNHELEAKAPGEDKGEEIVTVNETIEEVSGEIVVEPRREVNLWKRRSFAPPKTLHLSK